MTLTGHKDGEDASTGVSYLEIARVLIDHGAQTDIDLRELWSRIVFNLLVSNTDDHLRNHGFIMVPGTGWRLSETYDLNPVSDADGLRLNISEADNSLDLELALSVAPYFRVDARTATGIIEESQTVVRQWRKVADGLDIPAREQDRMAPAFRLAG
jgi:serine/threonine-protein kinase HipA